MGLYVNQTSNGQPLPADYRGKINQLKADGAEVVAPEFQENLIAVVDNGPFAAAAYAFSRAEFVRFKNDRSGRPTTWLVYPHAKELAD